EHGRTTKQHGRITKQHGRTTKQHGGIIQELCRIIQELCKIVEGRGFLQGRSIRTRIWGRSQRLSAECCAPTVGQT
ncbi:MAG: hypothetical protein HC899_13380, partial [Leptolyngbyaceae cyanobacterium SM1_4_3]|nr:hypothetical protein [Leptolyngbyaceae cyanobacterium SM1_4_3]